MESGSRPEQRVVIGSLGQLPELATRHAVQSPALLILGEVASLATTLHWFGPEPLQDRGQVANLAPHGPNRIAAAA